MHRIALAAAILLTAFTGCFFVGALGAFMDDSVVELVNTAAIIAYCVLLAGLLGPQVSRPSGR